MATNFQVIFRGQALPGFTLEQLKTNVAKLYNTEIKNIESLFKGSAVVIKDDLDQATATKYADVFRNQGAQCEVRDKTLAVSSSSETTDTRSQPPKAESTRSKHENSGTIVTTASNDGPTSVEIQSIGAAAKCTVELDEYVGSMIGISVAESGATMAEFKRVEMPDINISNFEVAAAGETIIEFKEIEKPDISTEAMSLAPTGTDLKD